jgi:outer membrane protein assembly factor BamB
MRHLAFRGARTKGLVTMANIPELHDRTTGGQDTRKTIKVAGPTAVRCPQVGFFGPSLSLVADSFRKAVFASVALAVAGCASMGEVWKVPFDGSPSTPVLSGGVLYVGSKDGAVYALDPKSGAIKWRFQTGEGLVSGTEIITVRPGAGLVEMIEAAESRGTRRGKREVDASPVVSNGTVFIGSRDYSFYALDAVTGRKKWSFETGGEISNTAVIDGSLVLFTSGDGFLYALNAGTGEKKWAFETLAPGIRKSEPNALLVADGLAYLAAWVYIYAVDLSSGAAKWSFITGTSDYSHPSKTHDLVLFSRRHESKRDTTTLVALGAVSGKVKWQFDATGNPVDHRPVPVVRETIILGTDRNVFAVDRDTGTMQWKRDGDDNKLGPTYASDSLVYITVTRTSTRTGTLHALDAMTGKERWSFSPAREIVAVPKGSVCVAAEGNLYSLHKETGKEVWRINAKVETEADPLVTSDMVFISGRTQRYFGRAPDQGYFYAIDPKKGER